MIDINRTTLSDVVKSNIKAGAVFEQYNLDFCCKGNRTISDACKEKNVDADKLVTELNALDENTSSASVNFEDWSLDFMIDYIINTHHNYIRRMIPIISTHASKVASVHGKNHPEVQEINRIFNVVYRDLKTHMMKEEEILFPHIKFLTNLKNTGGSYESPYFGTVKNPIRLMEKEHQAAGDDLFQIRELSSGYNPPADACNTFRALYSELKEFEEDLHKHVHLENYILFPKAAALEEEMSYKVKAS